MAYRLDEALQRGEAGALKFRGYGRDVARIDTGKRWSGPGACDKLEPGPDAGPGAGQPVDAGHRAPGAS